MGSRIGVTWNIEHRYYPIERKKRVPFIFQVQVVDMGRIHITQPGESSRIRPHRVYGCARAIANFKNDTAEVCLSCCCHGKYNLGSQNMHAMVDWSQSKEMQFSSRTKDGRRTHEEADRLTGLLKFEMVWNLVRFKRQIHNGRSDAARPDTSCSPIVRTRRNIETKLVPSILGSTQL